MEKLQITYDTTLCDMKRMWNDLVGKVLYDMKDKLNERFDLSFALEELSDEEVFDIIISKYKRADGQYVLHGDFASREFVEKYVKENYRHFCVYVFMGNEATVIK